VQERCSPESGQVHVVAGPSPEKHCDAGMRYLAFKTMRDDRLVFPVSSLGLLSVTVSTSKMVRPSAGHSPQNGSRWMGDSIKSVEDLAILI